MSFWFPLPSKGGTTLRNMWPQRGLSKSSHQEAITYWSCSQCTPTPPPPPSFAIRAIWIRGTALPNRCVDTERQAHKCGYRSTPSPNLKEGNPSAWGKTKPQVSSWHGTADKLLDEAKGEPMNHSQLAGACKVGFVHRAGV